MTSYHRTCGLNPRNVFPHSSGGQKSSVKVSAGFSWVSPEASLLGSLRDGCLLMVCVLFCSSYEDNCHRGVEPTPEDLV